jgi:TonB family protein
MGGTLTEPLATETQERVKALGLTQDWDEPPARLKFERPKYPESASKKGIEGTVILEVVIDARGRVAQTRVLQSISALDAAAVKCVKKWSFRPAKKAGRPVATLVHVPVTFRIPSPQVNVEPDVERAPKGSIDPPGGLRQMGPLAFDPEGADFTPWINHFKEEIYRNWILPRAAEFGFRQLHGGR